jgi:hypothetical protein
MVDVEKVLNKLETTWFSKGALFYPQAFANWFSEQDDKDKVVIVKGLIGLKWLPEYFGRQRKPKTTEVIYWLWETCIKLN